MGADIALLSMIVSVMSMNISINQVQAQSYVQDQQEKETVLDVVPMASVEIIQPVKQIADYIQNCESSNNPNAVNWNDAKITGSPSRGLFQFQKSTLLGFAKQYGIPVDDWTSPIIQRAVAESMIQDGIASKHWKTCYSQYVRKN